MSSIFLKVQFNNFTISNVSLPGYHELYAIIYMIYMSIIYSYRGVWQTITIMEGNFSSNNERKWHDTRSVEVFMIITNTESPKRRSQSLIWYKRRRRCQDNRDRQIVISEFYGMHLSSLTFRGFTSTQHLHEGICDLIDSLIWGFRLKIENVALMGRKVANHS
jgi:hypothetical protein